MEPTCFVLWYEGILYSGAKSRDVVGADDIEQVATVSSNVSSSANGRPTNEIVSKFHRGDLRLLFLSLEGELTTSR